MERKIQLYIKVILFEDKTGQGISEKKSLFRMVLSHKDKNVIFLKKKRDVNLTSRYTFYFFTNLFQTNTFRLRWLPGNRFQPQ